MRFGEREALGVNAVIGGELNGFGGCRRAGQVDDVAQPHPGPIDVGHSPARDALKVADEVGAGSPSS